MITISPGEAGDMAEVVELAKPHVDKFLQIQTSAFSDMMNNAANEHEGGTVACTAAWFAATLLTVDVLGIMGVVLRAAATAEEIGVPDDTGPWSHRALHAYLMWLGRGDPSVTFTVSDALRAARRSDLN